MRFPTQAEGHEAFQRGRDDAVAGQDRDAGPWKMTATDSIERCLAMSYQRGYGYGVQVRLQTQFENAPTA